MSMLIMWVLDSTCPTTTNQAQPFRFLLKGTFAPCWCRNYIESRQENERRPSVNSAASCCGCSARIWPGEASHLGTAMLTIRPFALRLVGLCLILAEGWYVSTVSNGFASQNGHAGIEPVLRLEKARYVEGEEIRFWVGVKPKNSPTIPKELEELRKPCSLSVTRPDGSERVDSVGWPIDKIVGAGWSQGWRRRRSVELCLGRRAGR
jgi:hypothetical protein